MPDGKTFWVTVGGRSRVVHMVSVLPDHDHPTTAMCGLWMDCGYEVTGYRFQYRRCKRCEKSARTIDAVRAWVRRLKEAENNQPDKPDG